MSEARKRLNLSFDEFIENSCFEPPFKKAKKEFILSKQSGIPANGTECIENCSFDGIQFKQPAYFEKHIEEVHRKEFWTLVKRHLDSNPTIDRNEFMLDFPQLFLPFDEIVPMDVDYYEDSDLEDEIKDFDGSREDESPDGGEQEQPFYEDDQNVDEIVDLKYDDIPNLVDVSSFFKNFEKEFDEIDKKHAMNCFESILTAFVVSGITFEAYTKILHILLPVLYSHPNSNVKSKLVEQIKTFSQSKPIQRKYANRNGTYIPPEKVIVNGQEVGHRVDLKKTAALVLRNKSIVQSILDEEKNKEKYMNVKIEEYNSELTCCPERLERLLGYLRGEISADDFNATKHAPLQHKYFGVYLSFTNIPIEMRLKRQNIFLLAIASRVLMKKANATVNDIMKPIVDDLNELLKNGIDVQVQTRGSDEFETKNIKVALSTVVGDNLGEQEILGLRATFFKAFICRNCTADWEAMQNSTNLFPLTEGNESDIVEYNQAVDDAAKLTEAKEAAIAKKLEEQGKPLTRTELDKFAIKNRFGVVKDCVFTEVPGISIFNCSPQDNCHDIAEGVVPRILDLSFRTAIKNLTVKEICDRVNTFPFYHGRIFVAHDNDPKKFIKYKFIGKAVQKVEVLARFEQIFTTDIDRSQVNKGYRLFKALHAFCCIAFSYRISLEELPKLDRYAQQMILLCQQISDENEQAIMKKWKNEQAAKAKAATSRRGRGRGGNLVSTVAPLPEKPPEVPKFHVFPKLHMLLHYSDLIRKFGPMAHFSTIKYERKHWTFKNISVIMMNFKNPAFTFSDRHQLSLVIWLEQTNFINTDFFPTTDFDGTKFENYLNADHRPGSTKLKSGAIQHSFNKKILRKVNNTVDYGTGRRSMRQHEFWIYPVAYWQNLDGTVQVQGNIYELKQNPRNAIFANNLFAHLEVIQLKYENKFVDMKYIHHRNDFLYEYDDQFVLIRGLM